MNSGSIEVLKSLEMFLSLRSLKNSSTSRLPPEPTKNVSTGKPIHLAVLTGQTLLARDLVLPPLMGG